MPAFSFPCPPEQLHLLTMSGPSKKAKSEEMSDELTSALESIDGCQNEIDMLNEKVHFGNFVCTQCYSPLVNFELLENYKRSSITFFYE